VRRFVAAYKKGRSNNFTSLPNNFKAICKGTVPLLVTIILDTVKYFGLCSSSKTNSPRLVAIGYPSTLYLLVIFFDGRQKSW
jgi:hypothetical protein